MNKNALPITTYHTPRILLVAIIGCCLLSYILAQKNVKPSDPSLIKHPDDPHSRLSESDLASLLEYVKSPLSSSNKFKLAGSGPINGYFAYSQLIQILDHLSANFPTLISKPTQFGNTFLKQPLLMTTLEDKQHNPSAHKNTILINGAMHARELVAPTMVLHIVIELTKGWFHRQTSVVELLNTHRILVVPVVNRDGYELICKSFGTPLWFNQQGIRKNMNGFGASCPGSTFGGVDLNRNFDYAFPKPNEMPDACDEEYPGKHPFSEPETQAMRDLILKHKPYLVSALNFHSFGFMWDFPLNSQKSHAKNQLSVLDPAMFGKYESFKRYYLPRLQNLKYGNAMDTVGYFAKGEATDWMVLTQGLFAFSPELGDETKASEAFQTPKDSQIRIVQRNYRVVQSFFRFHVPKVRVLRAYQVRRYFERHNLGITSSTCFSLRFQSNFALQQVLLSTDFHFDRSYLNHTILTSPELSGPIPLLKPPSLNITTLKSHVVLTLCQNSPPLPKQRRTMTLAFSDTPTTPFLRLSMIPSTHTLLWQSSHPSPSKPAPPSRHDTRNPKHTGNPSTTTNNNKNQNTNTNPKNDSRDNTNTQQSDEQQQQQHAGIVAHKALLVPDPVFVALRRRTGWTTRRPL